MSKYLCIKNSKNRHEVNLRYIFLHFWFYDSKSHKSELIGLWNLWLFLFIFKKIGRNIKNVDIHQKHFMVNLNVFIKSLLLNRLLNKKKNQKPCFNVFLIKIFTKM